MATKESVFISCGGEDTRYSFVSHLCMAFCRRNISINLSEIEEANASVVVFSHDYAFSEPSLDDLVKVWRLRLENGHLVVPVLYGVAQSDVEQLNGSFGEAFSEHEGSDSAHRVPEWRKAVVEIARLPGHECNAQISESKFVEDIVTDVHEKLFPTDKLGIQSILLEIEDLICQQPWAIRCVGIWGMGGIGKTTVAQAAFARMSEHYEASCFIPDFDESFRTMGLHRLRGETLPAVFDINNRSHPRRRKRCLLVLDDVSNPLDAESFLGGFDRFGLGSLIIITSRDKQVLVYCGVKQIYEVRGLNEDESLHLFSRRAFGKDAMKKEFLNVSEMVVEYAMGNPKVLTYYGEKLKGKKPAEMKMAFLKLKQHTPHKIMELFKNNYDSLSDNERNIFLDIACFFAGETVDYVVQLFEACGFFPRVGIEVLVYKSLVFISDNRVVMHDLIRDVARQIVNGETTQIERRCRLWEASIIKYLLEEVDLQVNGTLDIQGISLDTSELSFDVKSMAFKKMYGLRVLKIYNSSPGKHPRVRLPNGLESLPNELRLLHWENYPLKSLPQKFNPENLVELNMSHSKIKKLWEGTKDLRNLKMIRLSHSRQLTEFPRLSKALNLEHIDVEGCTGLVKVSSSIQYLGKLVVLNLKGCSRLQTLPAMVNLKSLEVLNLSGCSELENIQDFSENIREIYLSGTAIREVPSSIENLSKLAILDLENCKRLQHLPMGVSYLKSLGTLKLSGCSNLVGLQNLDALYLRCLQHLDATKTTTMEESSHPISHHFAIKESKLDGSQYFQNSFALQFRSDTANTCLTYGAGEEHIAAFKYLSIQESSYLTLYSLGRPPSSILYSLALRLYALARLSLPNACLLDIAADIFCLPSLRKLDLSGNGFSQIPESIKRLSKLCQLYLRGCANLISLPEVSQSLIFLDMRGCTSLESFSSCLLPSLWHLNLSRNGFRKLPESIKQFSKLCGLLLRDCKNLTALPSELPQSLETLDMRGCTSLESFPSCLLPSLRSLDLSGNGFSRLPESIKELSRLDRLYLRHCKNLISLPELPKSLEFLDAHGCTSLESITWCFERIPRKCLLSNCFALSPAVVKDLAAKALAGLEHIELFGAPPELEVCLPTSVGEIPTMHISTDPRITMQLASQREQPVGFVLSVVVAFSDNNSRDLSFGVKCIGSWRARKGFCHSSERIFWFWEPWEDAPKLRHDHTFVFCQQVMKPRAVIMYDEVEFEFYPVKEWGMRPHDSCTVKQCGVVMSNALIDKQRSFQWKEWSVASKEGKLVKQMASEPKHPQESPPMNPETPHK